MYRALKKYDLEFSEFEITTFREMWKAGRDIRDISDALKRPLIELAALLLDQSDEDQIFEREYGLLGGEEVARHNKVKRYYLKTDQLMNIRSESSVEVKYQPLTEERYIDMSEHLSDKEIIERLEGLTYAKLKKLKEEWGTTSDSKEVSCS